MLLSSRAFVLTENSCLTYRTDVFQARDKKLGIYSISWDQIEKISVKIKMYIYEKYLKANLKGFPVTTVGVT